MELIFGIILATLGSLITYIVQCVKIIEQSEKEAEKQKKQERKKNRPRNKQYKIQHTVYLNHIKEKQNG